MSLDEFWQIIEATRAPTQEEQLELFKRELQRLAPSKLIDFYRIFVEQEFDAYGWDLWVVVWLCRGGMCSDDSFADFRRWLISRGRTVYDAGLEYPDMLIDEISQVKYPTFEEFGSVCYHVYEEMTGQRFPELDLNHPQNPKGGDWLRPELRDRSNSQMLNRCVVFDEMGDPEFAALEKRFPRTWEYCVQKGIITTGSPPVPSDIPTPEGVAATVDPNLATTDFAAYLKALNDAAQKTYKKEK